MRRPYPCIRMKAHAIRNAGNPAGEDAVIVVILDSGPNSPTATCR